MVSNLNSFWHQPPQEQEAQAELEYRFRLLSKPEEPPAHRE
jgi:hypothetical protein